MGVSVGSSIYNAPSIYESGQGGGGNIIGGRTYKTVKIGGVTWLAENLDFKFCEIGVNGNPLTPAAWYYNNDEPTYGLDGVRKCGLLYNWYAVKFLNDYRNSLIPGWHVPTNDEWTALSNAAGGTGVAGTKLKADNLSWAPSWGGTDNYGFKVVPAGFYLGTFQDDDDYAGIWSIDESGSDAYFFGFNMGDAMIQGTGSKNGGGSVRLVKD